MPNIVIDSLRHFHDDQMPGRHSRHVIFLMKTIAGRREPYLYGGRSLCFNKHHIHIGRASAGAVHGLPFLTHCRVKMALSLRCLILSCDDEGMIFIWLRRSRFHAFSPNVRLFVISIFCLLTRFCSIDMPTLFSFGEASSIIRNLCRSTIISLHRVPGVSFSRSSAPKTAIYWGLMLGHFILIIEPPWGWYSRVMPCHSSRRARPVTWIKSHNQKSKSSSSLSNWFEVSYGILQSFTSSRWPEMF